jgi:hypothetical protein
MSRRRSSLTYCLVILSLIAGVSATELCVNSPENRQCWGEFDIDTDYYEVTPDTGRTVEVHAKTLMILTIVLFVC